MPTPRKDWTRDELVLVLRLYMRLPFGRLHKTNPEIVELAKKLDRSPSSVGMKACNFASFDPELKSRGIGGLKGASKTDRDVWAEFAADPEDIAAEAERAAESLQLIGSVVEATGQAADAPIPDSRKRGPASAPTGDTEVSRVVRTRRVQSFFRSAVLVSYEQRCALSGIAIPELLVASHIIPWSESIERRADPTNGICLNALFDRAFDRGLISFDEDYRVLVSSQLSGKLSTARWACDLHSIAGEKMKLPKRFLPDAEAIRHHRQQVFR